MSTQIQQFDLADEGADAWPTTGRDGLETVLSAFVHTRRCVGPFCMDSGTRRGRIAQPVPSRGVTVRLTVYSAEWRRHVRSIVDATPGLVPVVKGNGYGFGRQNLAAIAAELSDTIAVGTIYELDGLPESPTPVVLTPTLDAPEDTRAILTVGSLEHVAALTLVAGTRRRQAGVVDAPVRRRHRPRREGPGDRAAGRRRVDPSTPRR